MPLVSNPPLNRQYTPTEYLVSEQRQAAVANLPGTNLQRVAQALRTAAVEENIAMTLLPGLLVASGVLECNTLVLEGVDGQVLYGVDITDPACLLEPGQLDAVQLEQAARIRLEPTRIGAVSRGEYRSLDLKGDAFFKVVVAMVNDCDPQLITDQQVAELRNELAERVLVADPLMARIWAQAHPAVEEVNPQGAPLNPASLVMRASVLAAIPASFGVFGAFGLPVVLGAWYLGLPMAAAVQLGNQSQRDTREALVLTLARKLPGLDDAQLHILLQALDGKLADLDLEVVVDNLRSQFAQRAPNMTGNELLERINPWDWLRDTREKERSRPDLSLKPTLLGAGLELLVGWGAPGFIPGEKYYAGKPPLNLKQLTQVVREQDGSERVVTQAKDSAVAYSSAGSFVAAEEYTQPAVQLPWRSEPWQVPLVEAQGKRRQAREAPTSTSQAQLLADIQRLQKHNQQLERQATRLRKRAAAAPAYAKQAVPDLLGLVTVKAVLSLKAEKLQREALKAAFTISERYRQLQGLKQPQPKDTGTVAAPALDTSQTTGLVLGQAQHIDETIIRCLQQDAQAAGMDPRSINLALLNQTLSFQPKTPVTFLGSASHSRKEVFSVRQVALGEHQRNLVNYVDQLPSASPGLPAPLLPLVLDAQLRTRVQAAVMEDFVQLASDDAFKQQYQSFAHHRFNGVMTRLLASTNGPLRHVLDRWVSGDLVAEVVKVTDKVVPNLLAVRDHAGGFLVSLTTGSVYPWVADDTSVALERFIRSHLSDFDNGVIERTAIIAKRSLRLTDVTFYQSQLTFGGGEVMPQLLAADLEMIKSNLNSAVFTAQEENQQRWTQAAERLMQFGTTLVSMVVMVPFEGLAMPMALASMDVALAAGTLYFDERMLDVADRGDVYRQAQADIALGKLTLVFVGAGDLAVLARPVARAVSAAAHLAADVRNLVALIRSSSLTEGYSKSLDLLISLSPRQRALMLAQLNLVPAAISDAAGPLEGVLHLQQRAGVIDAQTLQRLVSLPGADTVEGFLGGSGQQLYCLDDIKRLPAGYRVVVLAKDSNKVLQAGLSLGEGKVISLDNSALTLGESVKGWHELNLADARLLRFERQAGKLADGRDVRIVVEHAAPEFRAEELRSAQAASLSESQTLLEQGFLADLRKYPKVSRLLATGKQRPGPLLRTVRAYMAKHGFFDIKVRVVHSWDKVNKASSSHFLLVGRHPEHGHMAFDLMAARRTRLDLEPMVVPEPVWAARFQQAGGNRLMKYQDFVDLPSARTSARLARSTAATAYQERSVLLMAPDFYKVESGREWVRTEELLGGGNFARHELMPAKQVEQRYAKLCKDWQNLSNKKTEFQQGLRDYGMLTVPGVDLRARRDLVHLKRLFIRPDSNLTPHQLGALAGRINRLELEQHWQQAFARAGAHGRKLRLHGARSYRPAPQILVTRPDNGRCLPLARTMAVALEGGSEHALMDRMYLVAADAQSSEAVLFSKALGVLHGSGGSAVRTLPGNLELEAVIKRLADERHNAYLQINTPNHSMLMAVRQEQGRSVFHFYDPNIGLISADSLSGYSSVLKHYFSQRPMLSAYGLAVPESLPHFRVEVIDPAAMQAVPLNQGLTVKDLGAAPALYSRTRW